MQMDRRIDDMVITRPEGLVQHVTHTIVMNVATIERLVLTLIPEKDFDTTNPLDDRIPTEMTGSTTFQEGPPHSPRKWTFESFSPN